MLRASRLSLLVLSFTVLCCGAEISSLLPPDAQVIEKAAVHTSGGRERTLVLWMLHPKKVTRLGGCADWLYGDYWSGPTRLSLVDSKAGKIINTIEVRAMYEGENDPEHSFPIPFKVANGSYYVPNVNGGEEGLPKILNLRDFTGEGVAGHFALFEYEACGISLTSALGYSASWDRAIQYPVGVPTEDGVGISYWIEQVFGHQPVRPGHWDFVWDPGHGADGTVRERLAFDPVRQVFVRK